MRTGRQGHQRIARPPPRIRIPGGIPEGRQGYRLHRQRRNQAHPHRSCPRRTREQDGSSRSQVPHRHRHPPRTHRGGVPQHLRQAPGGTPRQDRRPRRQDLGVREPGNLQERHPHGGQQDRRRFRQAHRHHQCRAPLLRGLDRRKKVLPSRSRLLQDCRGQPQDGGRNGRSGSGP